MPLVDLHCDTIHSLMFQGLKGNLYKNQGQVDFEKLRLAKSIIQTFAMFVKLDQTSKPYKACMEMILFFYKQLSKEDEEIQVVKKASDIDENIQNIILSIEEGGTLEGKIKNLYNFYEEGIRSLTLTWNFENEIGYPNAKYRNQNNGLKPFGLEVVTEMDKLGMIIDVSHLSDQGFYDVINTTKNPIIASHSCARAIYNHERNLTDKMIRTISNHGGVIGLNFFGFFINGSLDSKIEGMIRHLKHIHNTGGEDVLAIGTDFDNDMGESDLKDISEIHILEDAMRKAKFSERQIEKCMYQNSLRVIKGVLL